MPPLRSIVLTVVGSALWNGALVGAGWVLGRNYDKVSGVIGPVGTAVTVALILSAIAFAVWWRRRRHQR